MRIQWYGSGVDIDTIPGFLTGVYVDELRRLGHEVRAWLREDACRGGADVDVKTVVVQDVDPRRPDFGEWLLSQRAAHPFACALMTQSDWWVDGGQGVNYADYVTDLYNRGAFDVVLSYSREGAEEYRGRGLNAAFMCAVAAPSWWEPAPPEMAAVDVVFVGSRYNERGALQDQYLDAIQAAGLSVETYGERQVNGFAPFSKMRDTLARGRVVLALTTPWTAGYYGACTGRVFTGPWAGRPVVSNYWKGMRDFFANAMEPVYFPEDAVKRIRLLLDDRREYQATLADQRTMIEWSHLYTHRIETLFKEMETFYANT